MALDRDDPEESYRPFADMKGRYPYVAFNSTLLSRDIIKGMILSSQFPIERIREQLRLHPYFSEPEDIPSWRLLWQTHDLREDQIPEVVRRFNEDFDNRRYIEGPEILHIAGLCLWISDAGQPEWPWDTVVARVKKYIDDVYEDRPGDVRNALPA